MPKFWVLFPPQQNQPAMAAKPVRGKERKKWIPD